jgi:acyl-coenzyme A thioesterase 9
LQHCSDDDSTTRPLLLVTASVDKMVLKKPIRVDTDLKVVGVVTWVGRSSLEIQMMITQPPEGIYIKGNMAYCFVFLLILKSKSNLY